MRQHHLESAIARATGESLQTIQQRGFGLVRFDSHRSAQRKRSSSNMSRSQAAYTDHAIDDFATDRDDG